MNASAGPFGSLFRCLLAFALAAVAALAAQGAAFELFVTQSPPGPQNQNPATWSGVLQYHANDAGGLLTPGEGIDRTNVSDPAGLAYRVSSSEVFVGNRHGNNQPSSISRFIYNPVLRRLTPNGAITGNGLYGVHQLAFHPLTGELFAANVNNGVSRFTFAADGQAIPNGQISSGPTRGVIISPDGKRLYVSCATSAIRQFDLQTGSELASLTVSTQDAGLHGFEILRGELYAAGLYADTVYRFSIQPNNDLLLLDSANINDPAAIEFSPDGREMFVTGHRTSDVLYRFGYDHQANSWVHTGDFDAQSSLGDILMIPSTPEPSISATATNSVVVYWPLPAEGWVLHQSGFPRNEASAWAEVQPPYQTNSTQAWVVIPRTNTSAWFRLVHP